MAKHMQNTKLVYPADRETGGFTIVELLIVMAVLISLIVAAAGGMQRVLKVYKDSATKQQLADIRSALLEYYKYQLSQRRKCNCSRPIPDGAANAVTSVLTGATEGATYRAGTGYDPSAFFNKLVSFLKESIKNPAYDAYNHKLVVVVDNGNWNSNMCNVAGDCARDGYVDNYCPASDYRHSLKVLVLSLGANNKLDSDLSDWKNSPPVFKGDDMGFVFTALSVDRDNGMDYTLHVLDKLAVAANNLFLQKELKAAQDAGGKLTAAILNTNYWTTGSPTLSNIRDFKDNLGFSGEDLKDYWGNQLSWNPNLRSTPPFMGEIRSSCGYSKTVVPTM